MRDATALERAEAAARQRDRRERASLGSPHASQLDWTPEGSRAYAGNVRDEGKEADGEEEPCDLTEEDETSEPSEESAVA